MCKGSLLHFCSYHKYFNDIHINHLIIYENISCANNLYFMALTGTTQIVFVRRKIHSELLLKATSQENGNLITFLIDKLPEYLCMLYEN